LTNREQNDIKKEQNVPYKTADAINFAAFRKIAAACCSVYYRQSQEEDI
jgi:hypothetical protein